MLARYKNLPIYLLLITTLGPAGLEKILGGHVPDWFLKQFTGSLLDLFPGSLTVSFYLIAALEISSTIALAVSLIKGEFLPRKEKPILLAGLILSEVTFLSLAFGQRITHQFDGAFQLCAYAMLTFLAGSVILKKEA
ncbi:MAG: hypothetical protein ACXVBE_00100 [Bdellovibrionota bacterium]